MSFWVPRRCPEPELLDGAGVPAGEAEESLADIEWVHHRLGGRALVRRHLLPLFEALAGREDALEVLDLECVFPPGQRREKRLEAAPDEGAAAELVVHPLDVGEARLGLARRDAGAVEKLGFGTPTGNPEAHRPCRRGTGRCGG